MNNTQITEAIEYFGRQAFKRLFFAFKDRIEALGKVGGSALIFPREEERKVIENWFGRKFEGATISISLKQFENRLKGSKFEGLTLWQLVEMITNQPIIFKKDRLKKEEAIKNEYFKGLLDAFPHPNAQLLINKMIQKERGISGFLTSYNKGDKASIEVLLSALSNLPAEGRFERVPVFAERIAGNPHYFDKTTKLTQALELLLAAQEKRPYRSDMDAEEKANLLSVFGLAKDDLHSFVTCYGLEAYYKDVQVKQWYWANKEKSLQNIPLRSINRIDKVEPTEGKVVFVLENSAVYSSVIDMLEDKIVPIVCTHGNFKLSGLLLLNKLVKSNTIIYYSGDIDVKGITMANYLKKKYGENVCFWRMGVEDYFESISQVKINEKSLRRLNYIHEPCLQPVIDILKEKMIAGYQEPLIAQYVSDIKQHKCKWFFY